MNRDSLLVTRARYGDRRAAKRLAARHLDQVSTLACVVGGSTEDVTSLAQQGFVGAVGMRGPFADSLVKSFASRADDDAKARLVTFLVDFEHRPLPTAAQLVGVSPSAARDLSARTLALRRSCRGWGLASGRRDLTEPERDAGARHASMCRHCRDRLEVLEKRHRELLTRAAGVGGVLTVGQLTALAAPLTSAFGGALATKAAVAVIGAVGAGALATGTAIVTNAPGHHDKPRQSVVRREVVPPDAAVSHATTRPATHPTPALEATPTRPRPAATRQTAQTNPTKAATAPAVDRTAPPILPLPTSLPLPIPGVSSLPLP